MNKLLWLAFAALSIQPLHADDRMISAGFGVTEIIFALNAQDKLVAADFTSRSLIKNQQIAQVGLHVQLSAEGIMALNPTHLIGTDEMGPQTAVGLIKQSGVQVITIPSGQDVPHLLSRIDTLSKIVGATNEAKKLKEKVNADLAVLKTKQCKTKPNAIFFMLNKSGITRVGGAKTAIDSIITLAGGHNPAQSYFSGYKSTSMESIVDMQPNYILISQRAWDMYQDKHMILDELPILRSTPAGRNANILVVPSGALLGGLGLDSIKVATQLNKQFCSD